MAKSVYDECKTIISNQMADTLLFYLQENHENIALWSVCFQDAFVDYVRNMVEELNREG